MSTGGNRGDHLPISQSPYFPSSNAGSQQFPFGKSAVLFLLFLTFDLFHVPLFGFFLLVGGLQRRYDSERVSGVLQEELEGY